MLDSVSPVRKLGHIVVDRIWRLGFAARFLVAVLRYSGPSFRRSPLTLRDLLQRRAVAADHHEPGVVRRLVLGLQGYETLQRYGSRPRRSASSSPCRRSGRAAGLGGGGAALASRAGCR